MKEIRIAGAIIGIRNLDVGRVQVFPGAGHVVASAIVRMSKNRHRVYIIFDFSATDRVCESMQAAVEWLQELYNKYGVIAGVS